MFTDYIHMRMFYKSVSRFRCSETADLTGKDEILRSQLCLSQILLGGEISIQLASNYLFMLVAVKERKLLSKQQGKKGRLD